MAEAQERSSKERRTIRTHPRPTCFLCGGEGRLLHRGLEDRVFGAPGLWDLVQCSTPDCDLTWLAMMPLPEDLGLAYVSYYTHGAMEATGMQRLPRPLVAKRLLLQALHRRFLWRSGLMLEQHELDTMTLRAVPPGRLLDVGCGSGMLLQRMRIAGWEVEGVDLDEKAIVRAWREYGVVVRHGDLHAACYPDGSFDAVTLNHVIEHVHDPIALLVECRRILRSDGRLILVTPNIASWGHARFGRNWRGLEPPRHLHLFSPKTLAETARRAGFARLEVRTASARAYYILLASLEQERHDIHRIGADPSLVDGLRALHLHRQAWRRVQQRSDVGDEILLVAHTT
jgi:2-polyprenyl-3-methyl-5-hydroxy-6-metoxy-1,4-benzoquinol methylase